MILLFVLMRCKNAIQNKVVARFISKYGYILYLVFLFLITMALSNCYFNSNQQKKIKFIISVSEEPESPLFDPTVQRAFCIRITNNDVIPIGKNTIVNRVYLNGCYSQFLVSPAIRRLLPIPSVSNNEGPVLLIDKKHLQPGKNCLTIESSLYNYPFMYFGQPLVQNITQYHFVEECPYPCPSTVRSAKNDGGEAETGEKHGEKYNE